MKYLQSEKNRQTALQALIKDRQQIITSERELFIILFIVNHSAIESRRDRDLSGGNSKMDRLSQSFSPFVQYFQ